VQKKIQRAVSKKNKGGGRFGAHIAVYNCQEHAHTKHQARRLGRPSAGAEKKKRISSPKKGDGTTPASVVVNGERVQRLSAEFEEFSTDSKGKNFPKKGARRGRGEKKHEGLKRRESEGIVLDR